MIKSGLVEQNYGYGTFPSAVRKQRWGNFDVARPFVDSSLDTGFSGIQNSAYQPSYVKTITPKSVTRPFQHDITPKIVNPPTFGQTTYDQVFGKKLGEVVDYVAERIKGGELFKPIGFSQVPVTKLGPVQVLPQQQEYTQGPTSVNYSQAHLSETLQTYLDGVQNLSPSVQSEIASQIPQLAQGVQSGRLSESDFKMVVDEAVSSSTSSYASALGNVETEPFSVFQQTETGPVEVQAVQRVFEPSFKTAQLVPIGQALESVVDDSKMGVKDFVEIFKDFEMPKLDDWKPIVENVTKEDVEDFIDDVKEADFKKEQDRKRLLEALKNYLEIVKKFETIENWKDRYEALRTMDEGDQLIIFNLLKNDQDLYELLAEELLSKSLPVPDSTAQITELADPLRMKRVIEAPWVQGKTVKRRIRGPKSKPEPIDTAVPKIKGPQVRPTNAAKSMDTFIPLKRGIRRKG